MIKIEGLANLVRIDNNEFAKNVLHIEEENKGVDENDIIKVVHGVEVISSGTFKDYKNSSNSVFTSKNALLIDLRSNIFA